MTLLKQINSLLFTLFILLMTSLLYFQFTETKAFMVNQMESDLNNTMTSLSLRLKPHLENGDEATVNTLVNVIFEGGFYKKVELTWLANNQSKVWETDFIINDVPQWFIKLGLFPQQQKQITITSGWIQLATLSIVSNPAIGYRELWLSMRNTLITLLIVFSLALIVVYVRLQKILKPLYEVAKHAHDVSHRKFHPEMKLPSTSELKEVVIAINSMSRQLKNVFKALDEEVDTHKKDTLCDRVSQLPNRLCLTGQINSWLSEPDFGALLLADFSWLNEVHSKYGFQMRDQTIKELAKKFKSELPLAKETLVARISNTEFAFLVRKAEKEQAAEYLQALMRLVNQEIINAGAEPNKLFSIGITMRTEGVTRSELLSQADNALQKAINEQKTCQWFYVKKQSLYTREAWKNKLLEAIEHNDFIFQWQPVQEYSTEQVIHREIYCSLAIEDKTIKAGQFMPYVERFSLGGQLDQCLLEALHGQAVFSKSNEPIAVNISRNSITHPDFNLWLKMYLKKVTNPHNIHFEISESGITENLNACIELCDIIEQSGAKFGVDNCGRQMGSLSYLQELKPHYIKLDMSLSCYDNEKLEENLHNIELCKALVKIAKGLDVQVIVTGVEGNKHMKSTLKLKADGYQGYINPPTEVNS